MNAQDIHELSQLKELIKEATAVFMRIQPTDLVVTCARKIDHDAKSSKWLAGVFAWDDNHYAGLVQVGQEEDENFQSRRDACLELLDALEEAIADSGAFKWEHEEDGHNARERGGVIKIEEDMEAELEA